MKTRPLGSSDISASIVGLGAWVLGGGSLWGADTDDNESVRTIQAALDLGVNSSEFWNSWLTLNNRKAVLDMLAGWKPLTEKYGCTLSQLVIAWTAAQSRVAHVLCGGRTAAQVSENARAGDLTIEPGDLQRIRNDVVALGAPAKT
jgi:aryl-alcohol dehydrogenase-like predicted oxidoreductase